jgi:small subunit ribosomal protein S16
MALKIRLRRMGRKKAPHYRIVIAESTMPRDGRFVATIGHYNPTTTPTTLKVDRDKATYWLGRGAVPTDTVQSLLKKAGVFAPAPTVVETAVETVVGAVKDAAGTAGRAAKKAAGAAKGVAETVVEAVKDAAGAVAERVSGGDEGDAAAAEAAAEAPATESAEGAAATPAEEEIPAEETPVEETPAVGIEPGAEPVALEAEATEPTDEATPPADAAAEIVTDESLIGKRKL